MEIDEQRLGAVTVIRPRGPLVGDDAPQLLGRIREVLGQSLGRFVVDLSAVPFLDSAGLEALADAGDELGTSGLSLKMCSVNETIREVLDLTDVASRVEQFEDINQGVRSFL